MKRCYLLGVFFLWALFVDAQLVRKTMLRLPDTGQKNSYTNTFGEDNDYNIYPPYYIDNGDGTITDTITGLMWQKTDGGEMVIENAILYCDTLTLAGYSDWRLPNVKEAFSILNMQYANPSLDTKVFTTSAAEYWWTSDRQFSDTTKIWVTNAGGGVGNHPKNETVSSGGKKYFHVRAVREINNNTKLQEHYNDLGDGVIYDSLTGLFWQQHIYNDTLSWEQALLYADTCTYANYTDWRLPNIKELQSLVDVSKENPCVNKNYFKNISAQKFWASTTLPNQTSKAWFWDTRFGITSYLSKDSKIYVWLVLGNIGVKTGINFNGDLHAENLIYPNPFHDKLTVQIPGLKSVYLYNSLGQLIYSGAEISNQNFSHLPKGLYIIVTSTSNGNEHTERLIKQ